MNEQTVTTSFNKRSTTVNDLISDAKAGDRRSIALLLCLYSSHIEFSVLAFLRRKDLVSKVTDSIKKRVYREIQDMTNDDFEGFLADIIHQEAYAVMVELAFGRKQAQKKTDHTMFRS